MYLNAKDLVRDAAAEPSRLRWENCSFHESGNPIRRRHVSEPGRVIECAKNSPFVGPLDQKMNERCANVIENKGKLWETPVRSQYVFENTYSCRLKTGMYLKPKDLLKQCFARS